MTLTLEGITNMADYETPLRPKGEICTFYLGDEAARWDDPTTYNPSIEFQDQGKTVILDRLEERENELRSVCTLFEVGQDNRHDFVMDGPYFPNMQDPYHLGEFIDPDDPDGPRWKVIGGVQLTLNPETGELLDWRDTYHRYKETIMELSPDNHPEPFLVGPSRSKDMRFAQTNSEVVVFPRPQKENGFGGGGRIGFFTTKNLSTLQQDLDAYYATADPTSLIEGIFDEGEWGGVNQVLPQPDGTIILVGHKASKTFEGDRKVLRYRPFVAHFDPQTKQLIGPLYYPDVEPNDFGEFTPKPHKVADLADVLFTAGIMPHEDPSLVWLITGIGDSVVGKIAIPNPLLHFNITPTTDHKNRTTLGTTALHSI